MTVNHAAYAYGGSNPSPSTIKLKIREVDVKFDTDRMDENPYREAGVRKQGSRTSACTEHEPQWNSLGVIPLPAPKMLVLTPNKVRPYRLSTKHKRCFGVIIFLLKKKLVFIILAVVIGLGLYLWNANTQSSQTQEEAIKQAQGYQPKEICTQALVPAVHKATGAKYTFSSGCLAPGWAPEQ